MRVNCVRRAFNTARCALDSIGSPDKRALFDDFGREGAQQGGFRTYSEYMEASGGKEASQDFYQGDRYVSRLSEDLWEQRVAGDMPWVVEFYAPWCSHCVTSAAGRAPKDDDSGLRVVF